MKSPIKVALTPEGDMQVLEVKAKGKPRGRPFAAGNKANTRGFKKGHDSRRNTKGRPPYVPFAERFKEELAKPAPPDIISRLRLPRHATKYDAVIAATLGNCMFGDITATATVRNIIEGLLPNKNYNLTVEMQTYMDDPGFREFLAAKHQEYIGELSNGQPSRRSEVLVPQLPAPTRSDSCEGD